MAQLGRVSGVGGESVAGEEDGDVVAVVVDDLEEIQPELEVWRDGGQGEAASCMTSLAIGFDGGDLVRGWLLHDAGGAPSGIVRLTVVEDHHVLCILVADPVALCVVGKLDNLGLEASFLHHGLVDLIVGWAEVPVQQRGC